MQILSAAQAAEWVKTGDTVIMGGVVSMLVPEAVMRAMGERYVQTGAPGHLTIICPNRAGWVEGDKPHGVEHFAHPGMISHCITSTFNVGVSPKFMGMVMDRQIEASVVPMGILFKWLRECTAQSPGLLTTVGMGTFFDPVNQPPEKPGDKLIARSHRVVQRVNVAGKDCLFMPSMKFDVAIIRGSTADMEGNITLDDEPLSGGCLQMAMAARTSGGKVIAVVKSLTETGTLHPRNVQVPGIFVDAVVVDPHAIQSEGPYEPAFTGRIRTPNVPIEAMPMGSDKVILRRAALELRRGDVVNLGYGMGTRLPSIGVEEGFNPDVRYSVEHGAIGGVPKTGAAFGAHYNPSAIIDATELFDFYHGGGLDAAILGFAEVDERGNVNVGGSYTGSLRGPGGFADIVYRTRKVLICGTLTSGGLKAAFPGDGVQIVNEGRHRKFKKRVDHVDLCGPASVDRGQQVFVITERCVFEIRREGLTLVEVAPGIDPAKHIAPFLDFEMRVAQPLRTMQASVFGLGPMGLRMAAREGAMQ